MNHILSDKLFGFRKGISTTDSMFSLLIYIYKNINLYEDMICLFYMTKACDCIDHEILAKKLIEIGINDNSLSWIISFMNDRSQITSIKYTVRINVLKTCKSEKVDTEIPQGSNLGPVLFLLYINDLLEEIT